MEGRAKTLPSMDRDNMNMDLPLPGTQHYTRTALAGM